MPVTRSATDTVSTKTSASSESSDGSDGSDGEAAAGRWASTSRSSSLGDSFRGRGLDLAKALKPATATWSMMVWTVIR